MKDTCSSVQTGEMVEQDESLAPSDSLSQTRPFSEDVDLKTRVEGCARRPSMDSCIQSQDWILLMVIPSV